MSSFSNEKEMPLYVKIFLIFVLFNVLSYFFLNYFEQGTMISIPWGTVLFTLFISLIESSVLIYIFYLILNKYYSNEMDFNFLNAYLILIEVTVFSIIITQTLNCGLIYLMNKTFDNSKPIKRYLKVTNKTFHQSYSSKSKNETITYYLRLTSWVSDDTYLEKVSKNTYEYFSKNDIVEAVTKSGYYNMPYYVSLNLDSKVDPYLFPPDTKFPLTEDEAKKIIEDRRKLHYDGDKD